MPYDFSIINIKEGKLYNLFKEEQKLKRTFRQFKYRPRRKFNGHTECFSTSIEQLLKEEIT